MSTTVPTTPDFDVPENGSDAVIQAQVRALLAAEPLPVQAVTGHLRRHYPAERVIAAVTELIRTGRVHMSESYPIVLKLRF